MKVRIRVSRFALLFSMFVLFYSCKKSNGTSLPPGQEPRSFDEVFEAFWNGINRNYVYWDTDTTNWNNMYRTYKPLFEQLNITETSDQAKSVQYFREMTKGFIDSHFQIRFKVAALSDSLINPALKRKLENPAFHDPLSYFALAEEVLDPGFVKGYDYVNNQGNGPLFVLSGRINKRALYFGFNEFSLLRSFHSNTSNSVKAVLKYFFDNLRDNPDSLQGVILDVRNNRGGDISDLNFLIGPLIADSLLLGHFHTKRGPNPMDFSPWISISIPPSENAGNIHFPIVVLADNFSASLSEAVAMAVHSLPRGIIVGEQTYGATGPLTGHDVFNAGSFDVGNFLSVETSSVAFKYIDNKIYEGIGFPPDVFVPYNSDSLSLGIDVALKRAIAQLN